MNRIQIAAQILAGYFIRVGDAPLGSKRDACACALEWADELLKQAGHGGPPVRTFPVAPPPVRR